MTIFREGLFADTTAIITGGGTGIGYAVASELIRLGANVAICGRRPEPLAEAAAELAKLREGAVVHQATCDIRDPDAIDVIGVFPSYEKAYAAWKDAAQKSVDNAHMRYFIAHLHRLRDEEKEASKTEEVG